MLELEFPGKICTAIFGTGTGVYGNLSKEKLEQINNWQLTMMNE
jgi:hypothetical protein